MGSEQKEIEWLKDNWPGEDVGLDRKFETMVFVAGERCILDTCNCGKPAIASDEFEMAGYQTAGEATAGHMKMCDKYAHIETP